MKYILFFVIFGILSLVGCDDSESLSPTLESEPIYVLPQGNHDYDQRILDWHKRCGFYVLYKFEPRDLYYNMGGTWLEMKTDTLKRVMHYKIDEQAFVMGESVFVQLDDGGITYQLGEHILNGFAYKATIDGDDFVVEEEYLDVKAHDGAFSVEEPDEESVGEQFKWAEEMFLNHYQDTLLRYSLPMKFILGKNLFEYVRGGLPVEISFKSVSNLFVLSHGDKSIMGMTQVEKREAKEELNKWFLLEKMYDKIVPIVEGNGFYEGMDYTVFKRFRVPVDTIYPCGVLNYGEPRQQLSWSDSDEQMKTKDLKMYINMVIDHSRQQLDATAVNGNYNANDCTGIFDDKKDKYGKIRKKYDILIKSLKDMGVDLQSIGDMYH